MTETIMRRRRRRGNHVRSPLEQTIDLLIAIRREKWRYSQLLLATRLNSANLRRKLTEATEKDFIIRTEDPHVEEYRLNVKGVKILSAWRTLKALFE